MNYFTDEQVKNIIKKVRCITTEQDSGMAVGETLFIESNDIKALMNLAVEAAIGEADGWKVTGLYERVAFQDKSSADAFCEGLNKGYEDVAYFVTPLYSVKELDN